MPLRPATWIFAEDFSPMKGSQSAANSRSLCFQSLTTINFCNLCVLITIQNTRRGVRGASRNQQLTNCSKLSPHFDSLCFHTLTYCPISKPFVLITLQQWGGVGGCGSPSLRPSSFPHSVLREHLFERHHSPQLVHIGPADHRQKVQLAPPMRSSATRSGWSTDLWRLPLPSWRRRLYFEMA